jgi:hypothetical protein
VEWDWAQNLCECEEKSTTAHTNIRKKVGKKEEEILIYHLMLIVVVFVAREFFSALHIHGR